MNIFLANINYNPNDGIYKKIYAQAKALSILNKKSALICKSNNNSIIITFENGNQKEQKNIVDYNILNSMNKFIQEADIEIVYIRHMIPSFKLVSILSKLKKKKVNIIYEIPTYPYYFEQIKASTFKLKTLCRLGIETIFWPVIYHYINRLVVIRSNSKVKMFKKMHITSNGIDSKNIETRSYNLSKDKFRLVTVGTLYPYHGYDRILKGLANCQEKVEGKIVEFHVIGSSKTIDNLKKEALNLGLKHVVFHGTKSSRELNKMFDNYDLALGCLALSRRNADIDTTLKMIEYYCRGIISVTSGITPLMTNNKEDKNYTIKVADDESAIDITELYSNYKKLTGNDLKELSSIAKEQFDWTKIMKNNIE